MGPPIKRKLTTEDAEEERRNFFIKTRSLCFSSVPSVVRIHPSPYIRDQIFVKRAIEIVARRKVPVVTRGRVIHVLGPGIDDRLPLRIHLVANRRGRKRFQRG